MNRSQKSPTVVPILSSGRHRNPRQGACFMEFASYLAGERWSDHPACTHSLLAALARDVNDLTSTPARDRLMPLIHRVIGLTGGDLRLTATIAMRAASSALPVASLERQRALAVGMLGVLASVDVPGLEAMARQAFATAPDTEGWARAYLATATLPREFSERSAMAIVHTSVAGIALACVEDADARLAALLDEAISDTESALRPHLAVPARDLVSAG